MASKTWIRGTTSFLLTRRAVYSRHPLSYYYSLSDHFQWSASRIPPTTATAMSTTNSSSIRAMSIISFPRLESATGRARKRRRRIEQVNRVKMMNENNDDPHIENETERTNSTTTTTSRRKSTTRKIPQNGKEEEEDVVFIVVPPYPKGQPWRILWPTDVDEEHGSTSSSVKKEKRRIFPTWSELRQGWTKYMETWEDGLRGEPSAEKLKERQEAKERALQMTKKDSDHKDEKSIGDKDDLLTISTDTIQENAYRNVRDMKETAEEMLDQAKTSKDDLQRMASDSMKLATECLKEFMSGYRQGRDQEIDKMLNEYFQDPTTTTTTTNTNNDTPTEKGKESRRRRKKKRANLR